ncbi:hypothetical protein MVEN_01300200 [Mycena venus]|uniref:Uncharacterized protein n=1 Tax=Mycena venus TaxID=2733690 RepID=A0A8H7CTN5_9AGAR|nr:hypothetical protein MVEN_01300200 [Mycena venus]
MDSTPDFADSQSQGPRHYSNAYDTAHDYGFEPSSDPHSDDSQNTIQGDELTVFFYLLANNYKLDIELRSDLHSFLDVARSLPPLQLKIALIQQATALSNQQVLLETKAICSTVHEVVSKVYKSLSDNLKITKEQMSEITAACKTHFTGRRFEFSNDDFKVDVIPYLEQHADTNGLAMIFEDKTQAHHKLLVGKVGLAASNTKTWLRRTLVNFLPDPKKNNRGVSVTTLATYLSNKCLGDSKHVRAKHAIWLIIIRFFIRHNEDLRFIVSTDNAAVDDDELEFPTSISMVPAKRAHTGAVVAQNSDGKRIEHFWRQITLFPTDRLALIVGDKSPSATAAATATASSSTGGRLSGALREGASARQPLTPVNAPDTNLPRLPGFGGMRGYNCHTHTVHLWEFIKLHLAFDPLVHLRECGVVTVFSHSPALELGG